MEFDDLELEPIDLPLKTSFILMNPAGVTLDVPNKGPPYIELHSAGDGLVTIRSAEDSGMHLIRQGDTCAFGHPQYALKFKTKKSPAGGIVFEEASTGQALKLSREQLRGGGTANVLSYNVKYWSEKQSWSVLQQARPIDPCARCDLLVQSIDGGRSIGELKEILKLMTVTTKDAKAKSTTMDVERQQLILTLLMSGKSTTEVGELLTLMYGNIQPSEIAVAEPLGLDISPIQASGDEPHFVTVSKVCD